MSDSVDKFMEGWEHLTEEVHTRTVVNGFWEGDNDNTPSKLCLMHSELSEALEAYRAGNPPDDKIPEFSGIEAELADVIIRIMDFGKMRNLRIAEAVVAKISYNHSRPYKHGNKKC